METNEITQAVQLFDTPEKWSAFLALCKQQENLKKSMTRSAISRANSYFLKEHTVPKWSFKQIWPDEFGMVWYLTEYGENSVSLVFAWSGQFVLEARGGDKFNDVGKVTNLLKDAESRFNALTSCFERVDTWWDGQYMMRENYNFSFGSDSDTKFGPYRLAWYAQFKTEELVEQIANKVARFQTPEMTELLIELNELTRKRAS